MSSQVSCDEEVWSCEEGCGHVMKFVGGIMLKKRGYVMMGRFHMRKDGDFILKVWGASMRSKLVDLFCTTVAVHIIIYLSQLVKGLCDCARKYDPLNFLLTEPLGLKWVALPIRAHLIGCFLPLATHD